MSRITVIIDGCSSDVVLRNPFVSRAQSYSRTSGGRWVSLRHYLCQHAGSEPERPQHSDQSSATARLQGSLGAADDTAASSAAPPSDGGASIEVSWDPDASLDVDTTPAAGDPATISWDNAVEPAAMVESTEAPAGISWDVDVAPTSIAESEHAAAAAVSGVDAPVEIDWGIEMEAGGAASGDGAEGISIGWDVDGGDDGQAEEAQPRSTAGGGDSEHASSFADRLATALASDNEFRNRRFPPSPVMLRRSHDLT